MQNRNGIEHRADVIPDDVPLRHRERPTIERLADQSVVIGKPLHTAHDRSEECPALQVDILPDHVLGLRVQLE